VDIGICMSRTTLREKLKLRDERNPEAAWNLRRWPQGFGEGQNRLFVASDGMWCGYFKLAADALYNPDDEAVPYTILFDTHTWTLIPHTPVKRFRGFTYGVPRLPEEGASATDETPPAPPMRTVGPQAESPTAVTVRSKVPQPSRSASERSTG
jgi:hypothetical protein